MQNNFKSLNLRLNYCCLVAHLNFMMLAVIWQGGVISWASSYCSVIIISFVDCKK